MLTDGCGETRLGEDPKASSSLGTVLVTGATGFLGRWLVRRLDAEGSRVVTVVRAGVGQRPGLQLPSGVEHEVCELRDVDSLLSLLDRHGVRTVFHLAGDSSIHASRVDPTATFEANIRGTWSVLEACRRAREVSSVIIASSDKVYGEAVELPYREETPLRGTGPYEASKACADLIAQSYGHHFGLPVAVLRPGNFYGGGDTNWSRLVPSVVRAMMQGEPVRLRSDGSSVRDYLYVEDAVDAFCRAARLLPGRRDLFGEPFNVATRNGVSTADLVQVLAGLMGYRGPVVFGEERSGEISRQSLDPSRFEREFGEPAFTDLMTGLSLTVAWYEEHLAANGSLQPHDPLEDPASAARMLPRAASLNNQGTTGRIW